MKGYSFKMVTRSATRAVLISRPVSTFPMEASVSRMRSGIQTGSMGVLESALMMRALSLFAVRTLARQQQNMDFPQPGFPHTVMIFDICSPPPYSSPDVSSGSVSWLASVLALPVPFPPAVSGSVCPETVMEDSSSSSDSSMPSP